MNVDLVYAVLRHRLVRVGHFRGVGFELGGELSQHAHTPLNRLRLPANVVRGIAETFYRGAGIQGVPPRD